MPATLNKFSSNHSSPYEAAIDAALNELQSIADEERLTRNQLTKLGKRAKKVEGTIRSLTALLPDDLARKYEDMLVEASQTQSEAKDNRGGELYNNVVSLVRSKPNQQWNSAQIRDEFAKSGMATDTKSILNVLNYLTKTGRMKRISRGRYQVMGMMIEGLEFEGTP